MSSFSLRSQRTGLQKEFSILDILRLLGDPINDEIWLEDGEDVFNLSSFRETGGGGGSGTGNQQLNWSIETPEQVTGQRIFSLRYQPANALLLVILNGIVQAGGKDYILDSKAVAFPFPMNAQDSLQFIYQS